MELFEHSIMSGIRKAIREELSVSSAVAESANGILRLFKESFVGGKTRRTDRGYYVLHECTLTDRILGNSTKIGFRIYNFKTQESYDRLKYEIDCDRANSMCNVNRKLCFINVSVHAVENRIDYAQLHDSIQHEVEHIFQTLKGSRALTVPDDKYMSAVTNIYSENKGLKYIANAIYYSYDYEQDAFVNGLYGYLMDSESPIPQWSDITESDAYVAVEMLRKSIRVLTKNRQKLAERCMNVFGISIDDVISNAVSAERRLLGKIGKVLIKVRNDKALNEGFRILASTDGRIRYFI